jgi:hypothetical protein
MSSKKIFSEDAQNVGAHSRGLFDVRGMRLKGVMKTWLLRGRIIVDNGTFTGKPGAREFLRRKTYTGVA